MESTVEKKEKNAPKGEAQPSPLAGNRFATYQLPPNKDILVNALIYAESGVGKTEFAVELAKHYKVLYLNAEKSLSTIQNHPLRKEIQPNLDIIDVSTWEEISNAFSCAYEGTGKYKWVIVDSLTDLNRCAKDEILSVAKEADSLSLREWGKVSLRMEKIVRYFRDLKINTMFIALSKNIKNDSTQETKAFPAIAGSLKEECPAMVDLCGYMYTYDSGEESKQGRAIQFFNSPRAIGKDRFDKLETEILPRSGGCTAILKKLGLL